jgi:hypothetical protein
MLHMAVITWEPPQRDAALKRFAAQGAKPPAGVKILGTWADINCERAFMLVDWGDVFDPKNAAQFIHSWGDLCKIEPVTVMNAEELIKVVLSKK